MKNKLFVVFTLLSLPAFADQGPQNDLVLLKTKLGRFICSKNWAYTLNILGIDMLIGSHQENLQRMLRSKAPKTLFKIVDSNKTTRKKLFLKKSMEIVINYDIQHLTFFKLHANIHVFGLSCRYELGQGSNCKKIDYDFNKHKFINATSLKEYAYILDSGNNKIAFSEKDSFGFCLLDPAGRVVRKVKLQDPLFVRNVWELESGEYLIHHFPFNSAELFSIVDGNGRVRSSFYDAKWEKEFNLREYFIGNFFMTDFCDGMIYLTKVYPDKEFLEVEEIDYKRKSIKKMKAAIDGFFGQRENFKRFEITSIGDAKIAAVNGVFASKEKIYVSLSLNNNTRNGESFAHYIYVFDREGLFQGNLVVPYGAVLYHDRMGDNFIALKDKNILAAGKAEFVLFKIVE
jgi:hypothetical protein